MPSTIAASHSTVRWLSKTGPIAIPIYQREYRWSVESCARLLRDIREVASAEPGSTHFIGSVLLRSESVGVILIDGQQRLVTISLLLAAIAHHAAADPSADASVRNALFVGKDTARLKVHETQSAEYGALLPGISVSDEETFDGTLTENFTYFRTAIANDWADVWEGVQRLEHVEIELSPAANPQQVFESLNSTGERLDDGELIHNYLHMRLSHDDQVRVEEAVWKPIAEKTGDRTSSFWRDFLILTSDTRPDLAGELGVYRAFRARYPRLDAPKLVEESETWRKLAGYYGQFREPDIVSDERIAEQLGYLKTFGSASYPLLLGIFDARESRVLDDAAAIELMERIQTLFVRRALVGLARDASLVGPICREMRANGWAVASLVRRTPEDFQIERALGYQSLPHPAYVLARLQGQRELGSLQIEHIYPQNPSATWTGDGTTTWSSMPVGEQSRFRALLQTIGNLTLLESNLNQGAGNRSFLDKAPYYRDSAVDQTRELAKEPSWGLEEIAARSRRLTADFLHTWSRPADISAELGDESTPVVELLVAGRSGSTLNKNEFEYAMYRDEIWGDVHDVRTLFTRLFERLWDERRAETLEFGAEVGIISPERVSGQQQVPLDGGEYYLYRGWVPRYLLTTMHDLLGRLEFKDVVRVKLSAPETSAAA